MPWQLCLAYGAGAPATIVAQRSVRSCGAGVVVVAAVPSVRELWELEQIGAGRVLVVAGELDGVTRFSHFAARWHVYAGGGAAGGIRFAAVPGAAHHSFANDKHPIPRDIADLDLAADVTPAEAHRSIAAIIAEFARAQVSVPGALAAAEAEAARLSTPVVLALELEGSAGLGHPACNSDYPTNPGCKDTSPCVAAAGSHLSRENARVKGQTPRGALRGTCSSPPGEGHTPNPTYSLQVSHHFPRRSPIMHHAVLTQANTRSGPIIRCLPGPSRHPTPRSQWTASVARPGSRRTPSS